MSAKLPPLLFHLAFDDQPDGDTWETFLAFAQDWNKKYKAQFTKGTGIENEQFAFWEIKLPGGMDDPEMQPLNQALEDLRKKNGLVWHLDKSDHRTKEEYSQCGFVCFISDGYQDAFYTNAEDVITYSTTCNQCHQEANESGQVLDTLVIDESLLKPNNKIVKKHPGGLDLINLPNGGFLVSKKTRDVLLALNPSGYTLHPVINAATGKHSEQFFFITATQIIVDPCHEHTPRVQNAICEHCGAENGTVYGNFYIQENQLDGAEIFSINRYGCTGLYFSQRVFNAFLKAELKVFSVVHGVDVCQHR